MKIAILRRNGLGDFICTIPLIKFLQRKHPNSKISVFIDNGNYDLANKTCPDINIIIIPKGNKYLSIFKTALKFRKEHFDIAISAKPSPMKLNNLFLWLLGAKMRYAVVSATQWHSKLINHPTTLENVLGYHQALKILRTFSPDEKKLSTDFFPVITPNNKNNQEYPLILFSVSNNRTKSLISNEQLALIACKIAEHYPTAKFIISALPNDIHLAENLTLHISKNSQIVISNSLNEFLILLSNMTLIIVGDGGICHLAAALQKKLVALYGVTKPENWAPLATEEICITLYDPEDVNNINLDKVNNAIFSLLEK
ncbi:glycosyltransferase family 9 protein [Xenorhabdus bovienii]|nr:glycosyltransferase family 9 protein [Xenorhabdus bovienii]MDE9538009.1 hypothetical protein [Xenorhabdus bovienii]